MTEDPGCEPALGPEADMIPDDETDRVDDDSLAFDEGGILGDGRGEGIRFLGCGRDFWLGRVIMLKVRPMSRKVVGVF